ncbi:MAG TPA: 2-hydroxyacyl-CoA dehydratase family protein [Phycisphaerae bacterium]|nr:2-hydroxyacyl-CoA dehydratase family protein [Phycisphaerae bacterium]
MNAPLKALDEMIRLTSPFPESVTVKEWRTTGRKVIGWFNPYVPEEIIHAAGMLPFEVTGNNEPVEMQGAEAQIYSNSCSKIRTCWQLQLDGKYRFLDGLVSSHMCDQDMRLFEVWSYYNKLPYMELIYAPRKRDEVGVQLYLKDLEVFRSRLSQYLICRIPDEHIANSIKVYNRGRELMKQLYELRKRERPPVTGAEALEVSKAAVRMPRERFNELMEQLLDEIERTGREIKKAMRLMLIGSDLHNSTQIANLETLDAVVVVDEMDIGIRRAWGQVDTKLPPLEALARHYVLGRPVDKHNWNSDGRLEFIGELAEQYKVNGIVSQIVRFCTYNGWDKFDLKKQMQERGIPILEIDLEYGHPAGAQVKIRAEAFMEMLESHAT